MRRNKEEIRDWLIAYIADLLGISKVDVDPTLEFERFGLDSAAATSMTGDLEDWLGYAADPTLPYDFPTINTLAGELALRE